MRSTKKRRVRKVFPGRTIALSKARLGALIEEATVDAYNDAEQVLGLFTMMEEFRSERGFDSIAYGVNVDDQGDFRPGQAAAQQHRVAAPLREAGLTKQEIRDLARAGSLRIWDKPASACLSSRIEYGREVTREALAIIEQGEEALRALGFRQFRVRHHGDIVRIEIAREELTQALNPQMATEFTRIFKTLGFKFVTLDLEGFRSGSMNAMLAAEVLTRGR